MKTRINTKIPKKKKQNVTRVRRKRTTKKVAKHAQRKTIKGGATEIISIPLIYLVAGAAALIAISENNSLPHGDVSNGTLSTDSILNIKNPFTFPSLSSFKKKMPTSVTPTSVKPSSVTPSSVKPKSTTSYDNNYVELRDRNREMIRKKYIFTEKIMGGPGTGDNNVEFRKKRALEGNDKAFESAGTDNGEKLEKIYNDIKKFILIENDPDKVYEREVNVINNNKDMNESDKKEKLDKSRIKRDDVKEYMKQNGLLSI